MKVYLRAVRTKRRPCKGDNKTGWGGCAGAPTFADVPLLYEAPQHVGAAMAVRWLVKRLLAEAVPMAGWSLS